MTFKLFRRGSARCFGLLSAFITILICLYYISIGQQQDETLQPGKDTTVALSGGFSSIVATSLNSVPQQMHKVNVHNAKVRGMRGDGEEKSGAQKSATGSGASAAQLSAGTTTVDGSGNVDAYNGVDMTANGAPTKNPDWGDVCYVMDESDTNITTNEEYGKFDFQPEWIHTKEYWDRGFEERFEAQKKDYKRPPLKIFVVPHSHNDPGWLKTFVNYFQSDSRQILNLIVTKMQEYTDMTFIWSEISFLQLWWDQAHPTKQRALKKLIKSGRFEITTGGWVMTDEANVHLYAMLDQLIEGHQWLRNNLNVTPTVGWSIDPFGHGSTVPYLLSGSNFEGAIIQRIHYAWKQWFARQQKGDFMWTPYWQQRGKAPTERGRLLTHNMPFDIYSIKGSCGPHPFICLNFDFRKIPGEYTEYSVKAQFITDDNVESKAQVLLEQYSRTASLFPHNVALIPVGDDFRYNKEREVDQQYTNYKKLIDHIMANKRLYNVDISFGTPRDYFNEIRRRTTSFPTLKGDFFVYSDIFSEGRPAYWSGYYTTRPFYKLLSADLEHNLRAAEILFTVAYNTARQVRHVNAIKIFEKNYEKMIHARRNLGLFQHHDAITGTSKAAVMRDYGMRLFESIQDAVKMQESTIEMLVQEGSERLNFLLSELERDNFSKLARKTPIPISGNGMIDEFDDLNANAGTASFVIFNSLAQKRLEVITLRSPVPNVKVLNERGEEIRLMQINPVWNITDVYEMGMGGGVGANSAMGRIRVSTRQYEIMFIAELDALSLATYSLVVVDEKNFSQPTMATIYCDGCTDGATPNPPNTSTNFVVKAKPSGDIQLENNFMRLLFDEKTGFLKTVTRKSDNEQALKPMQCAIKFAAYRSAQFHSGAYLFKTDPEQNEAEKDVLDQYEDVRIIISSGPIASDVTVIYGPFLAHTVRIFNTHTHLDAAMYIENDVDFEPPPKNRETELFMRFVTDVDNIITVKRDDVLKEADTVAELPVFYSDQNGFQYHKRIKVPAIGIEGNYFPITSGAFIQDARVRFTLLTTHAQGAASYEPGQLEVMLDRRTLYDDYRGMGEGIVDSRLTRHKFWVLIEDMPTKNENAYQIPSLLANQLANGLRYPPNLYFVETFDAPAVQLKPKVALLDHGALPCDVHLLNLRALSEEQLQLFPSTSALMVLQRQGYDCAIGQNIDITRVCAASASGLGPVGINRLHIARLETTSLTGTLHESERKRLKSFAEITLDPMEMRTFNVTFKF
ncbi:alpha-mannosidase 2 [Bactrocera dorsalis]|uniref:Alpha-mannosidase n=1 Tax=Bactrocera dorsalis TaxID=27457 RepID=A0A6I9VH80_BACDO|nr:alpha-mannosidase 2 [Bactrocera dorsalis]XP_011209291.2 alpha-mannosidase 2 [Bactrocera dorsalis]XP_011209292.2 alpha-mannosidase 2 [Bactrocera dorsalis]XP_049305169.1 alpha-mannosidase 2 [Bactrocera dorsalis]XP_049305170.1 alpha-mannosidase 2 [Bactrocera dorsalis]XP_049305171.1 alpha-mannosidase 2 [Bactrocera dorsalis]